MVVEAVAVDMVNDHSLRTVTQERLCYQMMNWFCYDVLCCIAQPNDQVIVSGVTTIGSSGLQKPRLLSLERNHFTGFTNGITRKTFYRTADSWSTHVVILRLGTHPLTMKKAPPGFLPGVRVAREHEHNKTSPRSFAFIIGPDFLPPSRTTSGNSPRPPP